MGRIVHCIFFLFITRFLRISNGCHIGGGLNLGPMPNIENVNDTYRGIIRSEATSNIQHIQSISYGGALLSSQPYLTITHENSQFVMQTSAAFDQYEENETVLNFSVTITFQCTGGNTSPLIFVINISDSNNNYPKFIPTDSFEFVVTAPLPPGSLLTGCLNEIIVRDIDLTTSSIKFEIEENPYFEIDYDPASCPAPESKEFKGQLRTTTFIRSLREPITLKIKATDVDTTGDPPLSTSGTLRVSGDPQFVFPEEPVFSQTFYFATYTDDQQLIPLETISLKQGFDANVKFAVDGEYNSYFAVNPVDNHVSLVVSMPLPAEVLLEREIYVIVRADKEYTSGATATIVIRFPEDTPLLFESAYYEGSIVDNNLQLSALVLSQGYEGVTATAEIVGAYNTSFSATVQGDLVTVTMTPLTDEIIEVNSSILIQVVVSNGRSKATTIVTLEIIKDDNVTPVFNKSIYTGSYDPENGLNVDQIMFVQGFDGTVSVDLLGEHQNLFQINDIGPIISLTSSTIPPELFEEQRITLSIKASKPRTVGANAVVIITLPAARELDFEETTYRGIIQDDELTLQTIILREGYDQNVRFSHHGDYSTYFGITNELNKVAITLLRTLPESAVTQNSVLMLTIIASGPNAVSTTTNVILDIIKDDASTPVFSQNIYYGTYRGPSNFEITENIFLAQGYDDKLVSFKLDDSAYAKYFDISNTNNSITLTLQSAIPEDVIFNKKFLLFNVLADKALTVGSNAAVLIRFPAELTEPTIMSFSKNYYVGALEKNELTLENVILDTGYAKGTDFVLSGDYYEHFDILDTNNIVTISIKNTNALPPEIVESNDFIILTVEARRQRSVSVWTSVVIGIVKEEIEHPVFNQAYYRGVYTEENKLRFEENIYLSDGFDRTVRFDLEGEQATWFSVDYEGNAVTLYLKSQVPLTVLEQNNQLLFTIVAFKTNGISGRAVISIDLHKESDINFSQNHYRGYIEDGIPTLDVLGIEDFIIPTDVIPTLSGDYSDYFQVNNQNGNLKLELRNPIPVEILKANNLLILTLALQIGNSKLSTVIVLEIIHTKTENIELAFERTYYVGSYNELQGLEIDDIKINDFNYDTTLFEVEGVAAQWFSPEKGKSSVKLVLTNPIPPAVLANNQKLIFVINAQRPGSTTASATIVISLTTEYFEDLVLGFDRVTYLGSIENDQAIIAPITLSEGYVPGVVYTLHGELETYFSIIPQEATVTVTLRTPIPEQFIPVNRIIVLIIQASAPQTKPAYATLVFEHVIHTDPVVELIFAQTYYTGSYTETGGLVFTTPISLIDGYDTNVQFGLEGDQSHWFTLEGPENSKRLVLANPIPPAVLANNQKLIFVVNAQRLGSTTSRVTIVISLTTEYFEDLVLGFDRVTYLGSIENDQAIIAPITLSEGYVPGVVYTLHGELETYFSIIPQEATVTVTLRTPIPEQFIPVNRIIVLIIQASAPQTKPAYATLVFEHVIHTDPVVELIFAQTYYTGSYTETGGLVFTTPISLIDGYDTNVQFGLEGDQSHWFTLEGPENSKRLVLANPIPPAVLANNQKLIFVVNAQRLGSTTSRVTIVISLTTEYFEDLVLGFDRVTYLGSIENDQAFIAPITLSEGYVPGVVYTLHGELESYFSIIPQEATVTVTLRTPIPEQFIPVNRIIVLIIQASAPQTKPAYATLVFEHVIHTDPVVELIFAQTYYTGSYTETGGLVFTTPISLIDGYDTNVQFGLEGDQSHWFTLEGPENSKRLVLSNPIPPAVLANNQKLIFVVNAQRLGSTTSRVTIVISLTTEYFEDLVLGFDRVTYLGSIENDQAFIAPITLSEGYVPGVVYTLHGELESYFSIIPQEATVTVTLRTPIPEQFIPVNRIIVLIIQASAPQTKPAYATLVFEHVIHTDPVVELIFAQTYYTGSYTETGGLVFTTPISLIDGYDTNVQFGLEGDQSHWFTLEGPENSKRLVLSNPIPPAVLANNQKLIFVVNAQRFGSTTSRVTIVISLTTEYFEDLVLGFDRVTYLGSIENDQAFIAPITLSEGYVPGVVYTLHGELETYFSIIPQEATVTVTLRTPIPEQFIPVNRIIVLIIQASAPQTKPAYATLVFEHVIHTDPVVELIFAQTYYTGSYTETDGLVFTTPISLIDGYDTNVQFGLEGDQSHWFTLEGPENSKRLVLANPIPPAVLANNQKLIFVVNAQRLGSTTSRVTIVISLTTDLQTGSDETFDKFVYEGVIQNGVVDHEIITITGFSGTNVELYGEYKLYFESELSNGDVSVKGIESLTLPSDITHLALELRAGSAKAVLVLQVNESGVPTPTVPVVTFSSTSYVVRVKTTDKGLVGQVQASADNGEALRYSLQISNAHLQERLIINDVGELHLSVPVNSGLYTFQVVATTILTLETGTATVHLSAEAVTVCEDEIAMPPLIVLDRDEEQAHYDLIQTYEGCHFTLSNRWPLDQTWLYVNETGLHTTAIDREDESIAFMALSQVQVEIILHCETDETRVKRSLKSESLVPLDYGSSRWVLTDTIQYNSRRSLVNLIVNDINDNAPVFIGKEHEPIAVGYPVRELEERVLPRSLAELQATDADIGENAALLYWSSEPALAVAPATGFVHIRDGATLEHDACLTVHATDRNGHQDGLTGSVDIVVKLLDASNIVVVTVRDAFLDNESNVLSHLSESVGYEIKILRSVVISDDEANEVASRKKREVSNATGALLQLYIYGLIDREPVSIERLTADITNAVIAQVNIASTLSLEDHLAGQQICVIPGRDTGLLVATIVLSVLLFIIIVLIAVWFFLRWRRKQNYDQFSDANSLASKNESVDQSPKPVEVTTKPRLNFEELKKSERRLQEMLDAPIQEVTVEPTLSKNDAILDMPLPPDSNTSIVIQSIDKLKDAADDISDDEFGEIKTAKRKSVVTFNENVEKIIHIDAPVESKSPGYEIYKF